MKFYRYKIVHYASMDMDGEYSRSSFPSLVCETYNMFKETPCGYWIGFGDIDGLHSSWKKWVSKTSTKRFAYPTQEEALQGFIKRTEKRIKILNSQILSCNFALGMAEGQLKRMKDKKVDEKKL
jgi:hypothetical protein